MPEEIDQSPAPTKAVKDTDVEAYRRGDQVRTVLASGSLSSVEPPLIRIWILSRQPALQSEISPHDKGIGSVHVSEVEIVLTKQTATGMRDTLDTALKTLGEAGRKKE